MFSPSFQQTVERVREALSGFDAPIFVARVQAASTPVVQVGTLNRGSTSKLQTAVEALLRERQIAAIVRVQRHNPDKLKKVRSLEALSSLMGTGMLVLDRTKALARSEAVVSLGASLREQLGKRLEGVFFDATRRTLFLVPASESAIAEEAQHDFVALIGVAEANWRQRDRGDVFEVAIRVGLAVPVGLEVIAVDRQTVRATLLRACRHPLKGRLGVLLVGSVLGASITVPAMAADLSKAGGGSAVDAPNLSLTTLGGIARDPVLFSHLWAGLQAKGTIPLGDKFGAQVDLGAATDSYYGAALHLFARDPSMGLVGIVGSVESKYGVSMNRVGAEVEYYLNDNFTVGARVGYQGGSAPNGAFGRLDVKFYPDPNFAISAGGEAQPSFALARAGFEWRPAVDALPGMSISADADMTSTGNYRATFGLHFQLGGGAETLIDRDRKSDPSSAIYNEIDVSSAVHGTGYVGPH